MSELHIHERINNVLSILDHMTLTGFQQFNAVVSSMRELANLDQDIKKWEDEQKEEVCESCVINFDEVKE